MKRIALLKSKISAFTFGMLLLPIMTSAIDVAQVDSALDEDRSLGQVVGGIINIVLALLAIISIVLFLYGGFLWMTAGGNEENVAKAKKIITATVIGLAIILLSAAAVNFVLGNLINETGADLDGIEVN